MITETVFEWNGMGKYLIDAIAHHRPIRRSWPGCWSPGFIVVVGNLIADLLYAVLDPRIRYE